MSKEYDDGDSKFEEPEILYKKNNPNSDMTEDEMLDAIFNDLPEETMNNKIQVKETAASIIINGNTFNLSKEEAKELYNQLGKILKLDIIKDDLEERIRKLKEELTKHKENPDKFPFGNPSWPHTDKPWNFPTIPNSPIKTWPDEETFKVHPQDDHTYRVDPNHVTYTLGNEK